MSCVTPEDDFIFKGVSAAAAKIVSILQPTYVMRNGQLFDSETLDEIWPHQRKLERRWWLDWLPGPW